MAPDGKLYYPAGRLAVARVLPRPLEGSRNKMTFMVPGNYPIVV